MACGGDLSYQWNTSRIDSYVPALSKRKFVQNLNTYEKSLQRTISYHIDDFLFRYKTTYKPIDVEQSLPAGSSDHVTVLSKINYILSTCTTL